MCSNVILIKFNNNINIYMNNNSINVNNNEILIIILMK